MLPAASVSIQLRSCMFTANFRLYPSIANAGVSVVPTCPYSFNGEQIAVAFQRLQFMGLLS